jgi:hypothetical protein
VTRSFARGRLGTVLLLLVVGFLAGCAPYSGTTAQKVQQWARHSSFVSDNDTLVDDVIRVREAVRIGTVKQVRTICGGFASDVGTAYTTLPTPDQALTDDLNAADILLVDASTSCSGVSSVSSPRMRRALGKLTSGLAQLARAQRLLQSFGVTWKVTL